MPRQIIRTFGLDKDTVAFAQRVKAGSGTTILPNNLIQLNKFVVGIKRMGLWNQMVCWPMRSIHNAGRGSTVYSLGGLGIFNGTMVNSPSWENIGIKFIIPNRQYIDVTPITQTFNINTTSILAARSDIAAFVVPRLIGTAFSPASELTLWMDTGTNNTYGLQTWSTSVYSEVYFINRQNIGNMQTFGVTFDYNASIVKYLFNNTILQASRTSHNNSPALHIAGGQQPNDHWNGHISYCIRFYSTLTDNIFINVKNLAARTIGTGLNLI